MKIPLVLILAVLSCSLPEGVMGVIARRKPQNVMRHYNATMDPGRYNKSVVAPSDRISKENIDWDDYTGQKRGFARRKDYRDDPRYRAPDRESMLRNIKIAETPIDNSARLKEQRKREKLEAQSRSRDRMDAIEEFEGGRYPEYDYEDRQAMLAREDEKYHSHGRDILERLERNREERRKLEEALRKKKRLPGYFDKVEDFEEEEITPLQRLTLRNRGL